MLMVLGPHKNRSALKAERGGSSSPDARAPELVDEEQRVKPTTKKKDALAAFDPDQI